MRPDLAHRLTDKELAALEKRIAAEYRKAAREMQEKIDDYFEKFKERDEQIKALIGTIVNGKEYTENDYKLWRLAQIGRGRRFEALRDRLAERMTKANEVAIAYLNDTTPGVWLLNRNYIAKDIMEQCGNFVAFDIWDEETVRRLLVESPELMPYYPEKRAVKRGIDLAWGKRQISSVITSSILQGKSIKGIADDMQTRIPTMNRDSAIRAARTAMTSAQNGGRQAAAEEAEKMGIIIQKRWISIIDGRTRDAHIDADNQVVGLHDPFIVGGEKLMFPGDRSMGASGWNLYNCRCSYAEKVMGFKSILTEEQRKRANIRVRFTDE